MAAWAKLARMAASASMGPPSQMPWMMWGMAVVAGSARGAGGLFPAALAGRAVVGGDGAGVGGQGGRGQVGWVRRRPGHADPAQEGCNVARVQGLGLNLG